MSVDTHLFVSDAFLFDVLGLSSHLHFVLGERFDKVLHEVHLLYIHQGKEIRSIFVGLNELIQAVAFHGP
jgi:hypothetical protein